MLSIGIDEGITQLVVHIASETGEVIQHFRVNRTHKGLNELLARACIIKENPNEIICGIERQSGLVVDFLLQHNITVIPVPPQLVDSFRTALAPSGAKDDDRDSEAICHIVRTLRTSLRPLRLDCPLTRELKLTSRHRDTLVATKTAKLV
jgi:transposase